MPHKLVQEGSAPGACPRGLQEVPEGSLGGHVRQADVLAIRRETFKWRCAMRASSVALLVLPCHSTRALCRAPYPEIGKRTVRHTLTADSMTWIVFC